MRPTASALHAKSSDLYTPTHELSSPEVSRSTRAAPTSHKWTRTVCGAVRRPCLVVRDSAYPRGPRSRREKKPVGCGPRPARKSGSVASVCGGAARTAEWGRRGCVVTRHPRPRPRPRDDARRDRRVAVREAVGPRARLPLHRFQCESARGRRKRLVLGAWWRRDPGKARTAGQATAGAAGSGAGRCRHLARAPHTPRTGRSLPLPA